MRLALIVAVVMLGAAAPDDPPTCRVGETPYKGLDAPWKCIDVTLQSCPDGQTAQVRINPMGAARKWCR